MPRRVGVFSMVPALLLLGAGAALGGDDEVERVFKLKNGRRLTGVLVEETPNAYLVRSGGGRTRLLKETVLSIDPPPPISKFLEPETPKPPTPPAPPPEPALAPVETRTPALATPTPPPTKAAVGPTMGPLASADEIAAARKRLASIAPLTGGEREQARASALKELALGAVVSILAEPTHPARPTGVERGVALEVVKEASKDSSRPLLAKATAAIDLAYGTSEDLFSALQDAAPSDSEGVLENALVGKLADTLRAGLRCDALADVVGRVATERSFGRLFELLLTYDAPPLGLAVEAAVGRSSNAAAAVRPLIVAIDPSKHGPARIAQTCRTLTLAKDGAVPTLERILFALESASPGPERDGCVREACTALVGVSTATAHATLTTYLGRTRFPENRGIVLATLRNVIFTSDDERIEVLRLLTMRLDDLGIDENERKVTGGTLEFLTGKKLGTDSSAWREYVDHLATKSQD